MRRLPLRGTRVMITRAEDQTPEFAARLRRLGARVDPCPTIRLIPPPSWRMLDRSLRDLGRYDWLIFTSANGVLRFLERGRRQSPRFRLPKKIKTCAIGPVTARAMRRAGFPVTRVSKDFTAESILEALPSMRGRRVLIPRALEAREVLPRELKKRGARVEVVPVYRTVPDPSGIRRLRRLIAGGGVSCVTFTSSSTVKNFFAALKPAARRGLIRSGTVAASIGPVTTGTLRRFGWKPAVLAAQPTTKDLARAIARFYRKRPKPDRKKGTS